MPSNIQAPHIHAEPRREGIEELQTVFTINAKVVEQAMAPAQLGALTSYCLGDKVENLTRKITHAGCT